MPYWPRYLPPAIDRFEMKIVRIPEVGCWLWTGACDPNGYGRFRVDKRTILAHRFAYEHYRGPIGNAYTCHRCDVPSCCNPAHLFLGSQGDNMLDARRKNRVSRGEHRPLSVLTEQDILAIRAAQGTQREIAAIYGVHQVTVSKIKLRKQWSYL